MVNNNWNYSLLPEVCEINPGKRELREKDPDTEVSFLPMACVSEEGKILKQEKRKLKDVIKGYTHFRDDDVLVAKITPCFENGKRAIAKNLLNGLGFGSTEFHVLRSGEKVLPRWIYYAISRDDFINMAKSRMTGTAGQKRVPKKVLEEYEIPVPEQEEQEQISDAIETQFTRLDVTIKSLRTVKEKLEVYRKSVLKAAFEGELVSVSNWVDITVGDLGEIVTGTTPSKKKKEYYGEDYCFFKPTDLNDGYYVRKSNDKLSSEGIKQARLLPEKSVLVTCIGATIGKTGFIRVEGATNQQINAIVPNQNKYIPEIVFYLFISDTMQKQILENASSTTLPILNKSKFGRLKVKVPQKRDSQGLVVSEIESRFSVIDKVSEVVDNALKKAERLRKSILKSAFEGKLIKQVC